MSVQEVTVTEWCLCAHVLWSSLIVSNAPFRCMCACVLGFACIDAQMHSIKGLTGI